MKMLLRLFKPSLSKKIMLAISSVLILLTVIISIFSWKLSSSNFISLEKTLMIRSFDSMYTQLSLSLESVRNVTTQIVQQSALNELREMENPAGEDIVQADRILYKTICDVISASNTSVNTPIAFINVYLANGYSCCSVDPECLPYQNIDDCLAAMDACDISTYDKYLPLIWIDSQAITPTKSGITTGSPTRCFVAMRFLYEDVTLNKIGVMVIGVRQTELQRHFDSLQSPVYLVRSDGLILCSSAPLMIGRTLKNSEWLSEYTQDKVRTSPVALPDGTECYVRRIAGGAVWCVIPLEESVASENSMVAEYTKRIIYLVVAALLLAFPLVWLISKQLSNSIVQLKKVVQRIYDGDLQARFHSNQQDEIAYLGEKINDMLDQVEDFFKTQERDAAEKRNLELQLMQSQLNPHLLYNTLNSVVWAIRQNDMENAENLILSLSSFFRLALSKGREEIPLGEELSMIQYYLRIQNLGRGKNFSLQDNIPEELKKCRVLRMILQPLVENSVVHGFSDWRDDGIVTIAASADSDAKTLSIVVSDNGIGIIEEEINALMADAKTYPSTNTRRHYGIYNIARRIKNKYGSAYGLSMESEVGDHTTITLLLPLEFEGEKT